MQQSVGLLLADGWTTATPLFLPKAKMQIKSRLPQFANIVPYLICAGLERAASSRCISIKWIASTAFMCYNENVKG